MRRAIFICMALAVIAAGGCTGTNGTTTPTPGPAPIATLEPIPTVEPLPTIPVTATPTITPVPPSSSDPIIGTWSWHGVNNTMTTYYFMADHTFERHDSDSTQAYTGVWERQGQDTYQLIYNTPTPGIATETVTYHPSAGRMERNQTYYIRS